MCQIIQQFINYCVNFIMNNEIIITEMVIKNYNDFQTNYNFEISVLSILVKAKTFGNIIIAFFIAFSDIT